VITEFITGIERACLFTVIKYYIFDKVMQ